MSKSAEKRAMVENLSKQLGGIGDERRRVLRQIALVRVVTLVWAVGVTLALVVIRVEQVAARPSSPPINSTPELRAP